MTSRSSLAFFTLLLAFVGAIYDHRISKCGEKYPLTEADFLQLIQRSTHLPESVLCLLKCEYEEDGIMNPDKTMNIEKLLEKITKREPLDKGLEDELKGCMQKIAHPVTTCSQMQPYMNCLGPIEIKQRLQRQKT